jgi:hypothetical protein
MEGLLFDVGDDVRCSCRELSSVQRRTSGHEKFNPRNKEC